MINPRKPALRLAGFTERFAKVNGARLHYRIGGTGSAVILLHGYAQTGHLWRPIMPLLAKRHTVVVPDLRGAGSSAKPATELVASDVHGHVIKGAGHWLMEEAPGMVIPAIENFVL